MDKINVLSLFDGISGARQALNELGITNQYLASEVDKYAIKIAKQNHPTNFNLGDVKQINKAFLNLLGIDKVDLLNGKSVCLSANGGGKGAKTGLYAIAQRGRYNILGNTTQHFETSFNEKSNCLTKVQKDSLLLGIKVFSPYNNKSNDNGKSYSLGTNPHCTTAIAGQVLVKDLGNHYSIRRLTINECCRLQGFPDGYRDSVSKTQGYKALGNSFTVPVIKYLMEQIWSL